MLTQNSNQFLILCNVAAIINGVATITVMSAPPLVAALWFPKEERIFATSISQVHSIGSDTRRVLLLDTTPTKGKTETPDFFIALGSDSVFV